MGQLLARLRPEEPSALLAAVRTGSLAEVGRLAAAVEEEEGQEPALCLAARLGRTGCLARLLEAGLEPGREDRSGFSPLVLAVYGGHLDTVLALLGCPRVDVNQVCSSRATAFDVALISGAFEIAERIMDSERFDVRLSCQAELVEEQLLLMFCQRLNLRAVQLLVRSGLALGGTDAEGRGALWHATRPNRPRRPGLAVLVRRVRGDLEAGVRAQLVRELVAAGQRVTPAVLDNLSSSLPGLRPEAEGWMRSPPRLAACCRGAVWAAVRRGGPANIRHRVESLRGEHLPAKLVDYLLHTTC